MQIDLWKLSKSVLIFAAVFSLFSVPLGEAADLLHQFAAKYKAAKNERAKLAVCIQAVDAGLIARDAPVRNLDIIFGTNFLREIPKDGFSGDAVYFKKHAPHTDDAVAADTSGWFLAFSFDSKGKITKYYISNVNK